MATEFGQKLAKITPISVLRKNIEDFFTRIVRFSGSANLNMLSENLSESRELPRQPNLGKISKNCTNFSSVQNLRAFAHQ